MDLLALPRIKRRSASALHASEALFSEAQTLNLRRQVHRAVSVASNLLVSDYCRVGCPSVQ